VTDPDYTSLYSARVGRGRSDAIRDILAATATPGVLSMAGGLPAPDAFPGPAVAAAVDAVLRDHASAALQYGPTEGVALMREAGAVRATETGRAVTAENVLITSGSQQGLSLVADVFVDEGDVVALDDPSYLGAVQTFRRAGARLLPVPCDRDGMDIDALERMLTAGARCKLVYVVPHFHNPTGAVLHPARRQHLARLAQRHGFLIIEDDPYADLGFDGVRHPSIDVDHPGVIRLMSLSKTLCPGFRVAFLVAAAPVVAELAAAKQCADLQTNTFGQYVVAQLLNTDGFLTAHLTALRSGYRRRAERLARLLRAQVPWLDFDEPRGGLFLWCTTPPDIDTTTLSRLALEGGVAIVPGAPFCVESDGTRRMRLSHATLTDTDVREAVARLALAGRKARTAVTGRPMAFMSTSSTTPVE
jgi:Transcriptional regulators containing a DNA-binding HTH domain and an aminotransferase domain (MocR family) and their eukaryotic orthologs